MEGFDNFFLTLQKNEYCFMYKIADFNISIISQPHHTQSLHTIKCFRLYLETIIFLGYFINLFTVFIISIFVQ